MKTKINQFDDQGLRQGPWEESYCKGSFLHGERDGLWEFYYDHLNKIFRLKGSYLNGERTGTWNLHDMEGTLLTVTYHH